MVKTDQMKSKSERTRQFIIEQTAPVFNKKGYAGTSMSDLTEATGLTKGAIYGNFENKDEVALAAFDFNAACVINGIRELQAKAVTQEEKLMSYVVFYRASLKNKILPAGCPIANTLTEADDTHEQLNRKATDIVRRWRKNIVDIIEAGIGNGEFKKIVDVTAVASEIVVLIEGGVVLSKSTRDTSFLRHATDRVERIILQEIKA
jgi:TetR/AcrR family transcriptional repressor of nem operon